ncbi:MAG: hypothetical protein H7Z14_04840 [Anaerolineae bacterium]|nr:hypothetical protein [Phycisphaerae bacterium]
MLTRITLASLFCTLVLICGCFETPFSLGSESDAKVDTALCGDWEVASKDSSDKPKVKMFVRNLDGKHYLVEWVSPPEEGGKPEDVETLRMVAWTAKVKNATFAHARNLPDDGTIPDKHLVIRITFENNQITLRNLDEKFFKDKTLMNDADFRQLIEENLDNAEMYDHDEMLATRVAK